MTLIESGTYGAKRATWRDVNPREKLAKIIQSNSKASEAQWRSLFYEMLDGDQGMLHAIIDYWLDNNIRSLIGVRQRASRSVERDEATHKMTAQIKLKIDQRAQFLILTMPNGKPLGGCTGSECNRFGGWYAEIGKRVGPRKLVEHVLTEDDLRSIWSKQK